MKEGCTGAALHAKRHQRQEPFIHVLRKRLVAPGAELADCCRNHVKAATTARDLQQINCPVEHGCRLFNVVLTDVCEGQIPEDDRL